MAADRRKAKLREVGAPPTAQATAREEVLEAFLHFARLAASHLGAGVTFGDKTWTAFDADEQSVEALAKVAQVLRKDCDRVRAKMEGVMISRVHEIVTLAFKDAQTDPTVEENVEDLIEGRLLETLGIELTKHQKNQFAVNRDSIRKGGGPSDAAAKAIGRALGVGTGRSIYSAKAHASNGPPIPGSLNRWVPLRDVRHFVEEMFEWVEAKRRAIPRLRLDLLRYPDHGEAVIARVEQDFREKLRSDLDGVSPTVLAPFFGALLRGENPGAHIRLDPEKERAWMPLRAQLAAFGAALKDRPLTPEYPSAAAWLESYAELFAQLWMFKFEETLDLR
jgi:hypothetical protein